MRKKEKLINCIFARVVASAERLIKGAFLLSSFCIHSIHFFLILFVRNENYKVSTNRFQSSKCTNEQSVGNFLQLLFLKSQQN